jgi:hypothetical protein
MFCSMSRRAKSSMRRFDFALDERRRHLEGQARGELLHELGTHLALGRVLRLVLEVLADARAQRVERVELTEVLRELVVELREHAALQALDRDRVRDVSAGHFADGVVGREAQRERLGRPRLEAEELLVESRRVRLRTELDGDVRVEIGGLRRRRAGRRLRVPLQIEDGRCRRARCRGLRPARSARRGCADAGGPWFTPSSSIALTGRRSETVE